MIRTGRWRLRGFLPYCVVAYKYISAEDAHEYVELLKQHFSADLNAVD